MSAQLTHEELEIRLNKLCPTIKMIDRYNNAKKRIKYYCSICDDIFETSPNYFHSKLNYQCPKCLEKKIIKRGAKIGVNDLWTTHPEIAENLLCSENGYKYTYGSNVKLDWKCKNCGLIIKNKMITDICRCGLNCPNCSDGFSYPSKLFSNILTQSKINFETEKTFKWISPKRYDFYIPSINTVIETHGLQHYSDKYTFNNKSLKEIQDADIYKKIEAIKHGINYIEVDCSYSDFNWLKKSIINNKFLHNFINFNIIDWALAHKNALKSKVIEACNLYNSGIIDVSQIAKQIKIGETSVRNYLHMGTEIGLCNYDNKKFRIENCHVNSGSFQPRKIICLTTCDIFNSIPEINKFYNSNYTNISACCKNKRKYCGSHPETKQRMVWMYYEDYIHTSKEKIKEKLNTGTYKGAGTPVRNINTNEVFESLEQASKKYNIRTKQYIKECCDGIREFVGVDYNGMPLCWEYVV